MKKALVTGGCGFVGSMVIAELLGEGVEVAGLDLPKMEDRFLYKNKARFLGADISDKESLRRVLAGGYDAVFHTAALFKYGVPRAVIQKVNVKGTENLCQVMLEHGIPRLINWGSSTVYGFWDDPKLIKDETFAVNEKDLVETYCWSKREQEKMGENFIGLGLQVTTIRPGDIYGPGTPNGLAIPMFFFKLGLLRSVPGFRKTYISHIHVEDVARAAVHLAKLPQAANQIYNIADSDLVSNFETLELIAKAFKSWMLPHREKTLGIPIFHTAPALLKFSGMVEELRAKIKGGYPRFDRHGAAMLTRNHMLSNKKLLSTGFKLRWPSIRESLPEVLRWYEETNWALLKA